MPAKYHAFLDESGQHEYGDDTDRYFVVAGVIVEQDAADELEHELNGLKRGHFGSRDVEIKSHWLRQPEKREKRYLKKFGIDEGRLRAFVDAVYRWVCHTETTLIAGVVDKLQMREKYGANAHHPSAVGYNIFLQRYQSYLGRRRAEGAVTFDDISGASAAGNDWKTLLVRQHRTLKAHGCPYTRTTFNNVEDTLRFADSASLGLLQIADLTAYNAFRQFRTHGTVWDDPDAKELPVYEYFDRMLPRFEKDARGIFAGWGVAKMPTKAKHLWVDKRK